MQEIKFTSCRQYLFDRLCSIKGKKTQNRPKYTSRFFLSTTHTPSKVATTKKNFSSVYVIDATSFDECFLLHVVTGRHYF